MNNPEEFVIITLQDKQYKIPSDQYFNLVIRFCYDAEVLDQEVSDIISPFEITFS